MVRSLFSPDSCWKPPGGPGKAMKMPDLPAQLLRRQAVVYVRQSTIAQVQGNLESQRRQYELVDLARNYGFGQVELIDDDLGRSGSGTVDRPGFDRLVAMICTGGVGAVFCLEAVLSRLRFPVRSHAS